MKFLRLMALSQPQHACTWFCSTAQWGDATEPTFELASCKNIRHTHSHSIIEEAVHQHHVVECIQFMEHVDRGRRHFRNTWCTMHGFHSASQASWHVCYVYQYIIFWLQMYLLVSLYRCLLFRVAWELHRYRRSVCIRVLQACTRFSLSCKDHKSLRPSIVEALMLCNIVNKVNDGSTTQWTQWMWALDDKLTHW